VPDYVIVMAKLGATHVERSIMKVIGLIGGMSWNSTLEYYRIINESIARRLGGLHSARLLLYNLDFDGIEKAQHEGRWNDIASILGDAGNALKRAGADFLVICTNTMHKVADDVEQGVGLPLVHMVDVIGSAVREQDMHLIGVLGTKFLVEGCLYQDRLRDRFGIEVLAPEREDINTIHQIIYNELCVGKIKASSRRVCADIISRLINRGAQGIVLGCTELPLLIRPGDTFAPIFDTTRLHAEAAVNKALA
jgi:aspartate racemase